MIQYLVTVHTEPGRYRATVRETVNGRALPTGAAGIGVASTAPAAILAAVISARNPCPGPSDVASGAGNGRERASGGRVMTVAALVVLSVVFWLGFVAGAVIF